MKINTFQLIATIVVICFLSFGMISSSQAAGEITSLTVHAGEDWGEGGFTWVQLETDSDIYVIYCFIKQTYPHDEVDDAYEQVYFNEFDPGTRSAIFGLGSLEGHSKIANYEVYTVVFSMTQIPHIMTLIQLR